VSQRLPITAIESVISNAERRALLQDEAVAVPRVGDLFAALPAITGKIELEYEGELRGAEAVATQIVRQAVANVFDGHTATADTRRIIEWFERGGSLDLSDTTGSAALLHAIEPIPGFEDVLHAIGARANDTPPHRAAVADFILEGLCALKKITRTDDGRLFGAAPTRTREQQRAVEQMMEEDSDAPVKGKKKYYN